MSLIKNITKYFLVLFFSVFITKNIIAEDFGNKEEALALLERAVALVKIDKNRALDLFTNGNGGLHPKDLYPFCMNNRGILIAHPTSIGLNITNFKDSTGKAVGQEMMNIAKYGEVNEVDFMIARLTTDDTKEYKKTQLVTMVSNIVCVVGYYTE
jgi:cytochrome c